MTRDRGPSAATDRDRRRLPVSREAWLGVQDTVARLFRLRLDADLISDDDVRRLVALVDRAATPFGVNMGALSDGEHRDLERLVARGAGLDDDHFERQRREAVMAEQAEEAAAKKRRLSFTRRETTSFFRTLHEELVEENIWADDAAILTIILAQFAAGTTFASTSRFEGAGDDLALVIDSRMGLVGHVDGQGALDNWYARLKFLAEREMGWLVIEGRGPIWRIRLGPKLTTAFDPPETEAAAV
jgi:hypothetical protein